MPENRTRVRRDVGRYVNDALRDRYFAAADALYAMGAPIRSETDVETSFGTTHVYRYGPTDPAAESRTPVVLIHGAGYSSAMWYPNTPPSAATAPSTHSTPRATPTAASTASPCGSPSAPRSGWTRPSTRSASTGCTS